MGNRQTRFEALVQAHSADLYRFAYWLCRDRGRAEDLVQETFLRAWRALDGLREEKAAKGWLLIILRREYARGQGRYTPLYDGVEPDELNGEPAPSVEALHLRRVLVQLPEEYREPLLLQVLGGFSGEEIAGLLGIPPATAMTRLFRARQRLRAALAEPAHRKTQP
jgi:RNA polymerase sigma-70 factor (ECF subfamily)